MLKKLVLLSLLSISVCSFSAVYKCKNLNGGISFSDIPCRNGTNKVISVDRAPVSSQKPHAKKRAKSLRPLNKSRNAIKVNYTGNDQAGRYGIVKSAFKSYAINYVYAAYRSNEQALMLYLSPAELPQYLVDRVKRGQYLSNRTFKDANGRLHQYTVSKFRFIKGTSTALKDLSYQRLDMYNMGVENYSSYFTTYTFEILGMNRKQNARINPQLFSRFKHFNFSINGDSGRLKVSYEFDEDPKNKPYLRKSAKDKYYWKFDLETDVYIVR